ncbi:MAG: GNAT family N-acetyltransferase [Niameybacter sp.]|uniref:GNAT family N-acetyltransferase n=1 Tax=Niameybacter sp. TaxID=2033640 RepID=UPI002FC6568A
MSKNKIYFRPIQPKDYKALEQIISDTWNYERFCSSKTARKMARLYLASCLANQTFTCVAVNHEEPVGILMAKNEKTHCTALRHRFLQAFAILSMILSKEGRTVCKLFEGIDKLDQALLAESGRNFDGELAFFAVRQDQRGTGIGKALFQRGINYMHDENIQDFYLYTDSTCNYGFYEHQGMQRLGHRQHSLNPHKNETMSFFLYAYHFLDELS